MSVLSEASGMQKPVNCFYMVRGLTETYFRTDYYKTPRTYFSVDTQRCGTCQTVMLGIWYQKFGLTSRDKSLRGKQHSLPVKPLQKNLSQLKSLFELENDIYIKMFHIGKGFFYLRRNSQVITACLMTRLSTQSRCFSPIQEDYYFKSWFLIGCKLCHT